MSSAPTEIRKPRRKWGWLFVILFVIQAFVFGGLIGTLSADARRANDLALYAAKKGDVGNAQMDSYRARSMQAQVNMLLVACGVVSLICIGGMILGFRRRT